MVLNTFDLMEEGDEENRPKYRSNYSPPAPPPANIYGARPNDVPVVSPTPIDLSVAVRARTPIEASRLVLNDTEDARVWGFAAVSSADQPLRRYRPPDQGLCSGNGIVIAGNNLVFRAFNATDGSVLQGPIAPQDFYGMGGKAEEKEGRRFSFFFSFLFFSFLFFSFLFFSFLFFSFLFFSFLFFSFLRREKKTHLFSFFKHFFFEFQTLSLSLFPFPSLSLSLSPGDMSDPVCVYDGADSKRFYLGMFQWGSGNRGKYSRFMVAVSRSSDPVRDGWDGPFLVRNDGLDQRGKSLPGLEACGRSGGCMGDYPTMGMDKHSLWAGFNLFGSGYNGVLVLAISKTSMLEGKKKEPAAVAYSGWPGDLAFTVHPTTTQTGSQSSPGPTPTSGGAMFLLSTGPATQNDPSRNEVAIWAATDTAALSADDFPSKNPNGELRLPKISAPANVPVPAYRDTASFRGSRLGLDQPYPGIPLDGGDTRTAQAVFSGGLIWCAAQTAMHISKPDSPLVIGVVYWAFEPLWTPVDASDASLGYSFVPKLAATGYVGKNGGWWWEEEGVGVGGVFFFLKSVFFVFFGLKKKRTFFFSFLFPPPLPNPQRLDPTNKTKTGAGLDTALTGKPGKTHVGRPAITASAKGTAWIGGILTGLGTNPTAVAVEVDLFSGPQAMHVGAIAPTVIYPLSADERDTGWLRGGDYSAAAMGDGGETAWMSSQWSGGTGAKQCYSKFDAVSGGQGSSSCPSWGTWVSRAKVEVGGASAVERVAEKKGSKGSGGDGAAVGPAGAPSSSSPFAAPSPSGAPASAEAFDEASWIVVGMEAAAPVNRPSVEEKEDGKGEKKEKEREMKEKKSKEEGEKKEERD